MKNKMPDAEAEEAETARLILDAERTIEEYDRVQKSIKLIITAYTVALGKAYIFYLQSEARKGNVLSSRSFEAKTIAREKLALIDKSFAAKIDAAFMDTNYDDKTVLQAQEAVFEELAASQQAFGDVLSLMKKASGSLKGSTVFYTTQKVQSEIYAFKKLFNQCVGGLLPDSVWGDLSRALDRNDLIIKTAQCMHHINALRVSAFLMEDELVLKAFGLRAWLSRNRGREKKADVLEEAAKNVLDKLQDIDPALPVFPVEIDSVRPGLFAEIFASAHLRFIGSDSPGELIESYITNFIAPEIPADPAQLSWRFANIVKKTAADKLAEYSMRRTTLSASTPQAA